MLCHEQKKLLVVLVTVAADSIQQISGRDLGERQMGCVPHSLENPDAETLNIYPDESSYHICIECPTASFICEKDQGGNVRTISEPLGQSARIHGYQWNIDGDKQVAKLNSSLALWTRQVYCESQGESFHAKNIICNGDLCEDWKTILTETDIEQRVSRRSTATITMTNNHTDVMVQTLLQNSTLYTNGDTQDFSPSISQSNSGLSHFEWLVIGSMLLVLLACLAIIGRARRATLVQQYMAVQDR